MMQIQKMRERDANVVFQLQSQMQLLYIYSNKYIQISICIISNILQKVVFGMLLKIPYVIRILEKICLF